MDDATTNELLTQYWALAAALAIAGIVAIVVLRLLWRNSRRGRLKALVKERRQCRNMAIDANKRYNKARRKLNKLDARADKVPPKSLDEARGLTEDAARLCQIRSDQLKVVENKLRQLIVEEYPPTRHDRLRKRFDLAEHAQSGPFTFDGG